MLLLLLLLWSNWKLHQGHEFYVLVFNFHIFSRLASILMVFALMIFSFIHFNCYVEIKLNEFQNVCCQSSVTYNKLSVELWFRSVFILKWKASGDNDSFHPLTLYCIIIWYVLYGKIWVWNVTPWCLLFILLGKVIGSFRLTNSFRRIHYLYIVIWNLIEPPVETSLFI